MTLTRIPFRTQMRAAAVALLEAYADDANIGLQMYRGRPASISPPTGFVDRIDEELVPFTIGNRQRVPSVSVIIIHGLFDSGPATDQGDAFVDGFIDWIADNPGAAGPNTEVTVRRTQDVPNYIPDWLPIERQKSYYATEVTLEGFAAT